MTREELTTLALDEAAQLLQSYVAKTEQGPGPPPVDWTIEAAGAVVLRLYEAVQSPERPAQAWSDFAFLMSMFAAGLLQCIGSVSVGLLREVLLLNAQRGGIGSGRN